MNNIREDIKKIMWEHLKEDRANVEWLNVDFGTMISELEAYINKVRKEEYKRGEEAGKLYMSMMNKDMMPKVYSSDSTEYLKSIKEKK